jgi:hypothetical protein
VVIIVIIIIVSVSFSDFLCIFFKISFQTVLSSLIKLLPIIMQILVWAFHKQLKPLVWYLLKENIWKYSVLPSTLFHKSCVELPTGEKLIIYCCMNFESVSSYCFTVHCVCSKQYINYVHLYFFMLLLWFSAATGSHLQGVHIAISNASLSSVLMYQHMVVALPTLCSLRVMVSFIV